MSTSSSVWLGVGINKSVRRSDGTYIVHLDGELSQSVRYALEIHDTAGDALVEYETDALVIGVAAFVELVTAVVKCEASFSLLLVLQIPMMSNLIMSNWSSNSRTLSTEESDLASWVHIFSCLYMAPSANPDILSILCSVVVLPAAVGMQWL